MPTPNICRIEGCNNTVKAKGVDENGNKIFSRTCRTHHRDGTKKHRHRGSICPCHKQRECREDIKG